MFDTMTLTKIVGSVCGALLIFLLGNFAAQSLYSVGGGHGGDHAVAGYVIDTGSDDHGDEPAEEGPSFAELYAAADVGKGEKVFGKCKACHKLEDGANSTGPYLYGVVGRAVDGAAGYTSYSGALIEVADVWTPEHLSGFLESPKKYAPGTAMSFAGLPKAEDRANLIAFLDMTDGTKTEVEAAAEAAPAAEDHAAAEPAAEDAAEPAAEDAAATEPATEEPATEEAATDEQVAAVDATATAGAGDAEAGAKVFRACKACHKVEEGKNGVGPSLYGVVGSAVASVDGYSYSDALKGVGGDWTVERLGEFLTKPKDFAAGTKMSFSGVRDEQKRADLIAYLGTLGH